MIAINLLSGFVKRRSNGSWTAYRLAKKIVDAYQNCDVEMSTNGEHWLQRVLCKLGPIVAFDVGANIGEWSSALLTAGDATIYAFEPAPMTFDKLTENIQREQFYPFELALDESSGRRVMYFNEKNPYLTSLSEWSAYGGTRDFVKLEVESVTGDDFCELKKVSKIDILKIDAEGHDYNVLKGFEKKIRSDKIGMIQFEYNFFTFIAGNSLKKFFDLLSPNFIIGRLLPNGVEIVGYHPVLENFSQANFVAISKGTLSESLARSLDLRFAMGNVGELGRQMCADLNIADLNIS